MARMVRDADRLASTVLPPHEVDAIQMSDVLMKGIATIPAPGSIRAANHGPYPASFLVSAGPDDPGNGDDGRSGTAIITRTKPKTKRPSLYRVLLLNDDYTPMEFVVHVVEKFFNKSQEDAYQIMMHVHQNGVGECGIFTYEVAETKVTQVMDFARKLQHPLQCVMEKK